MDLPNMYKVGASVLLLSNSYLVQQPPSSLDS